MQGVVTGLAFQESNLLLFTQHTIQMPFDLTLARQDNFWLNILSCVAHLCHRSTIPLSGDLEPAQTAISGGLMAANRKPAQMESH